MEYHPVVNNADNVKSTTEEKVANNGTTNNNNDVPDFVFKPVGLKKRALQVLTEAQWESFNNTGILVIPSEQMWTADEKQLLLGGVNIMDDWPDQKGKWMKYYEKKKAPGQTTGGASMQTMQPVSSADEKLLCRIENFVQYNPALNFICNGQKILNVMGDLFGEPAVLYKEKINYKLPGGDGFAPHQDVAAGWWMYGQTLHISALVCVDEANAENGCLEVVYGCHRRGLLGAPWKEVPADIAANLTWTPAPTKPGDVVLFDSYVPHRSGPNFSQRKRRVLYATYSKESEGNYRDRYYADKRISFPPDVERDPNKKYEYKI